MLVILGEHHGKRFAGGHFRQAAGAAITVEGRPSEAPAWLRLPARSPGGGLLVRSYQRVIGAGSVFYRLEHERPATEADLAPLADLLELI